MKELIIIGAARSGTNMLRDLLSSTGAISTWPCDEINYIWRYNHASHPNDVFSPEMAGEKEKKYIENQFRKISRKYKTDWVLEKTCANTLRVPFVNAVFPNAKYIHIIRDGRDVACSAKERWTAKLDIPYLFKKARYVPGKDLPYYAGRYTKSRIYKLFSKTGRISTWGPRFSDIDEVFEKHPLIVASAIQWMESVKAANDAFLKMPDTKVVEVRYEEFTKSPEKELERIISKLDLPVNISEFNLEKVSNRSVGRWKKIITKEDSDNILKYCGELLSELGYGD